jgi:hypothetical protein
MLINVKAGPDRWSKWNSGDEPVPKDLLIDFLLSKITTPPQQTGCQIPESGEALALPDRTHPEHVTLPDAVAEWSRRRGEMNARRFFLEPLIIAAASIVTDDPGFTSRAAHVNPREVLAQFIALVNRNPLPRDAEHLGRLRTNLVDLFTDAELARADRGPKPPTP